MRDDATHDNFLGRGRTSVVNAQEMDTKVPLAGEPGAVTGGETLLVPQSDQRIPSSQKKPREF